MVPFFGSSVKTSVDTKVNENILDMLQGSHSVTIKKTEVAPLFKPEEQLQWIHGTPNMTDFYRSREMPAMTMTRITNGGSQSFTKASPVTG